MITKQEEDILNTEIFNKKMQSKQPNMNKFLLFFYALWEKSGPKEDSKKIEKNIKVTNNPLELTPIQIKVNQFIDIKEYDLISKIIKNGYELLPNQKVEIEKYIADLLLSYEYKVSISNNHYKIEKWLELGLNLNEETKRQYFTQRLNERKKINTDDFEYNVTHTFHKLYPLSFFYDEDITKNMKMTLENGKVVEFPFLTNMLKNYIQQTPLVAQFFQKLLSNLHKGDNFYVNHKSLQSTKNLIKDILLDERKDLLLKELNFETFLDMMTNFNRKTRETEYGDIKKLLQQILKKEYNGHINEIVSSVKDEYGDKYIEKAVIQYIKKETQYFAIENLPIEAQSIVKEIQALYKKIQHSNIELIETEKYTVNNLFNERVPEILKKYLTIDDQYKTTLTNANGKNAKELMVESLENICSNFEETWKNMNTNAISDLSATNKYTKSLK